MLRTKKVLSSLISMSFVLSLSACSQDVLPNPEINTNTNTDFIPSTSEIQSFNAQFNASGLSKKVFNIKVKKKLTTKEVNEIANQYDATVKRYIKQINLLTLESKTEFKNTLLPQALISLIQNVTPSQKIQLDPVTVEPVNIQEQSEVSTFSKELNDPMNSQQYSLKLIQAEEAWAINEGNPKVKIAILDTGVDVTHPDLKDKIVTGRNMFDTTKPPMDDNGHGTHCAGIAAAVVNNGEGIAGVASKCSIMPVKVLKAGSGTDDTIAEGIVWAADNGANVITMSLGLYRSSKPIEDALQYALDKGVTITASAGNNDDENTIHLPSTYPGVIEVGAVDDKDKKASFSNYGKFMSIAAPGVGIISTLPTYATQKPLNYGKLSGTSMAAPHVAGLVGLILSQKPNLKPAEVKKVLESTSKDLGDKGWDKYFGAGRIDALEALKSLQ
jgi:subtilisin family serine protease